MILTCPECATSYFVDDSRIGPAGRTVKCSNCGARWTATPEGVEAPAAPAAPRPAAPAPPPPPAAPVDELVVEEPPAAAPAPIFPQRRTAPRREANGKVLVWAVSAGIAAALIVGAIVFRAKVVQLAPATQAAYAGLGMPVSSLAIEGVRADPGFQGGRPVLSVTGQLRNLRDAAATAPSIRVNLLDRAGKPVAAKVAKPINAAVPARAVRHFAISIVDPPASVQSLEVSFEPAVKGGPPPATTPVPTPPEPAEAQPLPPGSPDALPSPR